MNDSASKSSQTHRRAAQSPRSPLCACLHAARDFLRGLLGKASRRDPLGPLGESLAARHLRRKGYRVLGKNLRVRVGEADVLALDPDGTTIVLVEVKTRRVREANPGAAQPTGAGMVAPPPEASVDHAKQAKLRAVLSCLISANGWHNRSVRIDVVAIEMGDDGPRDVRHHIGVVAATEARFSPSDTQR